MSRLETIYCKAHNNIYNDRGHLNYSKRDVRVELGIPDKGTNENTGLLILIPGYGGSIDSHVFKKMREEFCEEYNLVTMQCDYFGNRYMSAENPIEVRKIFEINKIEKGYFIYKDDLGESIDEFNDMGIMQALDIVSSTLNILFLLRDRKHIVNTKKIILFGVSHGAYVAHLANLICPNLFTYILDISAYIKPYYLDVIRAQFIKNERIECQIVKEQFINNNPQYRYNEKLYDLDFLYSRTKNRCKIIALQGTEDPMVKAQEKVSFINGIENAEIMLIGQEDVDGVLCKNAQHGLGLDFFEFFKIMMPLLEEIKRASSCEINIPKEIVLGDDETHMIVNYREGLPQLIDITF